LNLDFRISQENVMPALRLPAAQFTYDNTSPSDDADYQARIEAKAEHLRAEYRADADMLWESLGNVTAAFEAKRQPGLIKVLRDGGSDDEMAAAMRYLRELVLKECDGCAEVNAEGQVQREDDRAAEDAAEARVENRAYHWGDEL
jgi:hypothetical protein